MKVICKSKTEVTHGQIPIYIFNSDMKQSPTRTYNLKRSTSRSIIAYALLISQIITSCGPQHTPLPAQRASNSTGEGLELPMWDPHGTAPGQGAAVEGSQAETPAIALQMSQREQGQAPQTATTPSSPQKKPIIRYGIMCALASSATFTLWRAVSVAPITSHAGQVSNGWLKYTFPPSYHSLHNQIQTLQAKVKGLGSMVEAVETVGGCNAYRGWSLNDQSEQDLWLQQTLVRHQEECRQSGAVDLTQELADVQRHIAQNHSIENKELTHAISRSGDPYLAVPHPPLYDTTVDSTLPDSYPPKPDVRLPNVGKFNINSTKDLLPARRLFDLVDENGFGPDLRDETYGVHLWCYLIPGNLVKGKTSLGWPCSVDAGGWWVLAGNKRETNDPYFDNAKEFYTTVSSWKIQHLDCLGHVKSEEPEPRSEVQNKVIQEALALRMMACIQGAFSTLEMEHVQDGSWVRINPKGKLAYPISRCAHFFAGGYTQLYPNIFNGAGIYFYPNSLLTGLGSQIGEMYPECKQMVTSKWSAPYCADTEYLNAVHSGKAYLKLAPESNQACEDYKANMQQLETDLVKTQHELEMETEAVRKDLQDYRLQYEELEKRQKDLIRQYETGERSIDSILQDLSTIKEKVAAFNQAVTEKKKAIAAELREAEERAEAERKRLELNQTLIEKLQRCQNLNLQVQALHKRYSEDINQALDKIQMRMNTMMEENARILQALQTQQQLQTWETPIATMDTERQQDIDQQKALKGKYIASQAERLALLVNTTMRSEDRNADLNALHEVDLAIVEEVNQINTRSEAREAQYAAWRAITENTTQAIETDNQQLQQQLTSVQEQLLAVADSINITQQEVITKDQELDQKDSIVTECFNEAMEIEKEHKADVSEELQAHLAEAARLRKELEKLDQDAKEARVVATQAAVEKEHQRIQAEIDRSIDLVNQTSNTVYQRLANAHTLDTALLQRNQHFITMMEAHTYEKLYRTMQWVLDRSKGFERKMCAYLNNPILHNVAEVACNINSGFSNYLGSLDNSYMQIPSSVRALYADYRPAAAQLFRKLHEDYEMQLSEDQRPYKEMDRLMQEFSIKTANIFRIIYGEVVQANSKAQSQQIHAQMDTSVQDFMTFNQNLINTVLNAIPRLLSISAILYFMKAAYRLKLHTITSAKQSDFLAHGSKMAIIPTLAFMGYSLVRPQKDYEIGSLQQDSNALLMVESACLLAATFLINMATLCVYPKVEQTAASLGAVMAIYQFFQMPHLLSVTSSMPACVANIPAKVLATNNAHANAILSTNVLAERIDSYADQLGNVIGSSYNNANAVYFRHCDLQVQQHAEQQFRDIILTVLYCYNSMTLLSHGITCCNGHSYKLITKLNYTAFLLRCALCIFPTYRMPTIDFKVTVAQPGWIEMMLLALVMSMSVKNSRNTGGRKS